LASLSGVDVVLYLVEASRPPERFVLERLSTTRRPIILLLNKVDLLKDKSELLPRIEAWTRESHFAEIIPISALKGDGLDRVSDAVVARLPESEPLYPGEMVTDAAERFLAAELVREQVFLLLRQEVPYATCVTIDEWVEGPERRELRIAATIHVERDNQKAIV